MSSWNMCPGPLLCSLLRGHLFANVYAWEFCIALVEITLLLHYSIFDKMPVDFLTFLSQINDAVIAEDGHDLGFLLQPTSRHSKDLVKEFLPATVSGWYCVRTVEHELNKWLYRKNPWRDLKVSSLALGTRLQYLMS